MDNKNDFPPKNFSPFKTMATNLLWGFSHKNPQSAGKGEEPSRHNKFVVIHKHTQNTLLYSSLKDIKFVYTLVVYGHPLNYAVNVLKTKRNEHSGKFLHRIEFYILFHVTTKLIMH